MNRSPSRAASALRILITDDDAAARTQLAMHLQADGHQVCGYANACDALSQASWQPFDLALVDVRLAGNGAAGGSTTTTPPSSENGIDFIARLLAESPRTRVVVMSGHAGLEA